VKGSSEGKNEDAEKVKSAKGAGGRGEYSGEGYMMVMPTKEGSAKGCRRVQRRVKRVKQVKQHTAHTQRRAQG
jgi:hypothetical protein